MWQWVKHGAKTSDGQQVTAERALRTLGEEAARLKKQQACRHAD